MPIKNEIVLHSRNFKFPRRLVITLHGYGTCGSDFAEIGEVFLSKRLDDTIFLFPDGPEESNGIVGGRQWFPLNNLTYEEMRTGLGKTGPILKDYLHGSIDKFPCQEIIFIGFSQGTIMALEMIYHFPVISKIIGYSGLFVANHNTLPISTKTKVLLIHSDDDQVVPYENAKQSLNTLNEMNIETSLKTCHSIGHSISIDGWNAAVDFLSTI